jgi:tRNA-dihydrouridine synthase
MEGITTWVYRRAYHACFTPMDKYFTPFLVPHTKRDFNAKEQNEILPEHNGGQNLVPQILTNSAEDFIRTALALKRYGYEEVNLNLGCPSGTVVSKRRGSGFLEDPGVLDHFFEEIFSGLDMKISVKTRIGIHQPEEFEEILEVYNKYPLEELIIHPRVRQDFYKNHPNMEVFQMACSKSNNTLCYNGDLCTHSDIEGFAEEFPEVDRIMIGRGILRDPGLIGEVRDGKKLEIETLHQFHDRIYEDYREIMSGDRNTVFKMKEFWTYLSALFVYGDKGWKKIKKAQNARDYEQAVREIFAGGLA